VERALSRGALQEALGVHTPGVLPTVDELTELIANVEVQAFMQNFAVGDDLLRAAWYLHGVASATQAPELYSLPRQRRAFAVSAHIFDLALNDTSRGRHDRLTLTFAAQVGYRRAELDPNATAVYRRVVDLLRDDPDVPEHIDTLALQAGVAFLGLDPGRLGRLQRQWRRQLADLAASVGMDDLRTTMFGPAERVVLATSALLAYLRSGDGDQLGLARTALVSVVDLTAGEGDHDARWVAAHLLQIADGMATSSIWTVLPPDTPPAVAQAFTVGAPPVLTLWPPQRELLSRATQNPLDPTTGRLLLSVPTSAGKTLLAQVMIGTHLATQTGDVCYVTPLRSLGREMRQALGSRLRVLRRELGIDLPDYATASIEDLLDVLAEAGRGDLEVMTPERLMQQLRRDPEAVLERFSLFVIDEAHLLAQPGRGFLLESLLTFLTTASSARLVLLSGVLGNAGSLASWLAPDRPEVLYSSDWRGPRRMHALLYTEPRWSEKVETARSSTATLPVRATVPLIGKLRIRPAEGKVVDLVTEPLGTLVLNQSTDGMTKKKDSSSTPNYKMVAAAAAALLHAGSLLMVVSTRVLAGNAARVLAETQPEATSTGELVAFLEERLGAEHPLIPCVRRGVAYHHAGLPVDVLDAIEEAIRSDQLRAVVATSTLTDGVNLPVRTVLISETNYEGQSAGSRLDAARLLNAVGRAGRAGRETEGWIVLALHKEESTADFGLLTPEAASLEARSTMRSDEALASLAEAESLLAQTADAILRLPLGPASDFAGYVWFVLTALERLQTVPHAPDAAAAVQRLLGFNQMDADLRARWLAFADAVRTQYNQTAPDRRRRWTAMGTSLGSAARLEQIVDRLVEVVVGVHPGTRGTAEAPTELPIPDTLGLLEIAGAFDAVLDLPEAQKAWRFRGRRNGGESIAVALVPALNSWLSGTDITDLAEEMLPGITDRSWRLEHTVDAVSTAFEHYLSWVMGIVVEQANAQLDERNARVLLRQEVAALIRYGVDTAQALALLTRGIQSRRLAYRLGRLADERDMSVDDLREWLAELHMQRWRTELEASPREVLDLLEFTRARRQSLLRILLESGSAEVTVRRAPIEHDRGANEPRTVELRAPARAPAELTVLDGEERLGVVGPRDHTDVMDVLASGLDVTTVLSGETLTLTVAD
jgi:hypothetical protein